MINQDQEIGQHQRDAVADICTMIRARGLHINQPRKAVIRALVGQKQAVTAEALWINIRLTYRISISAVYNNLNLLVKEGVAEKMVNEGTKSTYRIKPDFTIHRPQSS